jgi:hypothetical protein
MFGILMLFVAGCWFWCAFVFITKDHSYRWLEMVLWVLLSYLLKALLNIFFALSGMESGGFVSIILYLLVSIGFLYVVLNLRFHISNRMDRLKILGVYYGGLLLPMIFMGRF